MSSCKTAEKSCAADTAPVDSSLSNGRFSAGIVRNHSFLTEKDLGTEITITGILSGNKASGFVLIENPATKSKVSFIIETSNKTGQNIDLSDYVGKNVTISGVLTGIRSPWSKQMSAIRMQ